MNVFLKIHLFVIWFVFVAILNSCKICCRESKAYQIDYLNFLKQSYGRNLNQLANELYGIKHFEQNFADFVNRYRKQYMTSEEIEYRKANFLYSLKLIKENNRDYESGHIHYKLTLNKFADYGLNEDFFVKNSVFLKGNFIRNALLKTRTLAERKGQQQLFGNVTTSSFDWRNKRVVTPVLDQGNCGSCWAFAATTTIETANAIAGNRLVPLSQQEILDCVGPPDYDSDACEGGSVDDVYQYAKHYGLNSDDNYPYQAKKSGCNNMSKVWKQDISKFVDLPSDTTDEELLSVVFHKGPVAVIVNAGDKEFQLYGGGVMTSGGNRDLAGEYNHYVTIVGFGMESGYDYWLIKNSWGTDWGEFGYGKLVRGMNNRGINTLASYVVAEQKNTVFTTTEPSAQSNSTSHAHQLPINVYQSHCFQLILLLLLAFVSFTVR